MPDNQEAKKKSYSTEHLANERTFLSWIRTSLGIMAFGFLVERFTFLIKETAFFLGKLNLIEVSHPSTHLKEFSSIFGIFLIVIGALTGILSYIYFRKVQRQIERESYRPSQLLDLLMALLVIIVAIFLIVISTL